MTAFLARHRAVYAVLVSALLLVSCSSGERKGSAGGPATTSRPVGDRVDVAAGSWVQVHSYSDDITPSNPYSSPRPGSVFAVIDVEGCAGPTGELMLNPFFFEIETLDGRRLQAGIPVKDPALNVSDLRGGACDRGLVTFEVAADSKPSAVVYNAPMAAARWSLR